LILVGLLDAVDCFQNVMEYMDFNIKAYQL